VSLRILSGCVRTRATLARRAVGSGRSGSFSGRAGTGAPPPAHRRTIGQIDATASQDADRSPALQWALPFLPEPVA
jgi:hypothetical protein